MSKKDHHQGVSFHGTDPFERIADLDKVDELEETLEVSDPSPLPAVPLDPETGLAADAPAVAAAHHADDLEVSESFLGGPDAEAAAPSTGDMPAPTILGKIGEGGAAVAGAARTNSIPVALLSIGIALLVRNRRHPNTPLLDRSVQPGAAFATATEAAGTALHATTDVLGEAAHKVADVSQPLVHKAEDLAHGVAETASNLGSATVRKSGEAKNFLTRAMQENPLVLGAVVLLLGVALGLLLPGTRRENELMGETRDNLLDKAQEVVSEIKETVTTVATTAASEVKETVKQAAQEVADNVREVAQDSAVLVKEEVADTVKEHGIVSES